jgi:spermidine synthase
MGTLNDIGLKLDADKSSRFHNYLDFYQKHLPGRDFKGRLLEIGVMDGLSVRMWREYYPDAEIVGIDIKDMSMFHNTDWNVPESVKLITADGTKAKDMKPLGKFDIILDDGSHYMKDQQKSFELLYYNQLNEGGLYILEDLWTSHIDFYQNMPITTIDYLKKLEAKGMKMHHFKYKHKGPGIETVFPKYKGLDSHTVVIPAGQ